MKSHGQKALHRSTIHNTVLNLLGLILPLFVGLASIPLLIRQIGIDRFGLLSLIWIVIGYFTFLDLGLGRAIIKLIAEKIGQGAETEIPPIFWNALAVMVAMTVFGSVVFCVFAPLLVHSVFKIPEALHDEAIRAFRALSLSLILVTLTAGYRGVLEAYHRFDFANLLQVLTGVSNFLVPLGLSYLTPNLFVVVIGLVVARLLIFLAHLLFVVKLYPALRVPEAPDRQVLRRLFHFATWMTVSNVVSPLMVYSDRFLLGTVVPVGTLAFYTTPFEIMSRLMLIPHALVRALFPKFALMGVGRSADVNDLFLRCIKGLVFILLPLTMFAVYFGGDALRFWLGEEFARESTPVLQILACGILLSGLGYLPYTLLQSAERPDLTGKIHLLQLPFYLPFVWIMARSFGIAGAAMAWSLRVGIDMVLMFIGAHGVVPAVSVELRRMIGPLLFAMVFLVPPFFAISLSWRIALFVIGSGFFTFLFWRLILLGADRQRAAGWLSARSARGGRTR